ncbi:MAG TPA: hypothetical protein VNU71_12865 [Burkholderiaceae bacterium]|nr:hypothetical protein [Burkholderiaceae bacterium]
MTLLQRGWNILAGGLMVLFIPVWFTQVEQGYYYTFLSLLALQVFFELGFNAVIVQLVSHEIAHLQVGADGSIAGAPSHLARLNSLLSLLRKWYLAASLLFFAVVSVAGYAFFAAKGILPVGQWLGTWVALVFFTSINLYLSPQLAVLEGIGRVGQVARMRLVQSVCGFALMWAALSLHAGLRAMPLMAASGSVAALWWVRRHARLLRPTLDLQHAAQHTMNWRTEIFPLQWRIALSWISGYFIFQAFVPLIFANQGAAEAGKVGIALTIFSSLSTLGMSWINASAPRMAQLIARDERGVLNQVFVRVLRSSTLFTVLSSLLLLLVVHVLRAHDVAFVSRLASLPILACLALVTITNTFIFAAATYMRAHKQEPMLAASIVGGLLTLACAYFGSQVSSLTVIGLYALTTVVVGLPWTVHLFLPFFRRPTPA